MQKKVIDSTFLRQEPRCQVIITVNPRFLVNGTVREERMMIAYKNDS